MTAPVAEPRPGSRVVGFLAVLRRELYEIVSTRFYLLFVFVLPLGSFAILRAIFEVEVPRDMPILVCDRDASSLSRRLTRMLDASAALAVVRDVRDMEEGAAWIRRGEVYAVAYIPENYEHDVKRGDAPVVTMYYNNQWLLTSGIINRATREILGTLSAGLDVRTRMQRGQAPAVALEQYEPIRLNTYPLFNPNLNYRYFLLPALLPTLLQAFIIMVTVRAIGVELKHGTTLEWLAAARQRTWVALTAKLLPYSVCFIVMTMFMIAALSRYSEVPFYGDMRILLPASILFVLAYQSMGFCIMALTANLRVANSLSGFYTGPAFAFAGITYPGLGMPLFAKIWSSGLPLTYYLQIMLQHALRGAPWEASLFPFSILLLFAAVPPVLLTRRMGRLMRDPSCWGGE